MHGVKPLAGQVVASGARPPVPDNRLNSTYSAVDLIVHVS
jgi:hypothetical protein